VLIINNAHYFLSFTIGKQSYCTCCIFRTSWI